MGSLRARIQGDLNKALKQRDAVRIRTLRLLESELHNAEIERRVPDLSDEDALRVIGREMKRRQDAIASYRTGGRADRAADEEAEAAILTAYLPAQMGDEALRNVIREVVQSTGAHDAKDLGKVMGQVMARVRGQADGTRVRELVARLLKGS